MKKEEEEVKERKERTKTKRQKRQYYAHITKWVAAGGWEIDSSFSFLFSENKMMSGDYKIPIG